MSETAYLCAVCGHVYDDWDTSCPRCGNDLEQRQTSSPAGRLAGLLNDIVAFLRRFVSFADEHQPIAVALWIVHTHVLDAADQTPYLQVKSAEKRSGKSRLIEVIEHLVRKPWYLATTSESALFRKIEQDRPTLLLDEVDAVFKGRRKDDNSEGLRGILNAGCRRGAVVARAMPVGQKVEVVDFSVFCPKLLAGIGDLPDTIEDRSIPIVMRRKARHEEVERWRIRRGKAEATPVRARLEAWATDGVDELVQAEPELPDALGDRAQDAWEPLVAIADLAGAEWPASARAAAVSLSSDRDAADDSAGVRLLGDIRQVLTDMGTDRIWTVTLIDRLCEFEEAPWGDWYGAPIKPRRLAELLRPYDVKPQDVKIDGTNRKGYTLEHLADAFARYLPPPKSDPKRYPATSQVRGGAAESEVAHQKLPLTCEVAPVAEVAPETGGYDGVGSVLDLLDAEPTSSCERCGHDLERRGDRWCHQCVADTKGQRIPDWTSGRSL